MGMPWAPTIQRCRRGWEVQAPAEADLVAHLHPCHSLAESQSQTDSEAIDRDSKALQLEEAGPPLLPMVSHLEEPRKPVARPFQMQTILCCASLRFEPPWHVARMRHQLRLLKMLGLFEQCSLRTCGTRRIQPLIAPSC